MALVFNERDVQAESLGTGVSRARLITGNRVKGTNILLDRWTFQRGGSVDTGIARGNLGWIHVLSGEVAVRHAGGEERLGDSHTAYLPPAFEGSLRSDTGAALLHVEVPDAGRFDPGIVGDTSRFRAIDWTQEPVLSSRHDSRRRIYLATPRLFGTRAIKAEMIIYPPGTSGSNHHHEGCEHFKYVLKGRGIGYSDEHPHSLRQGDVVYHPDLERHYTVTQGDQDVVFIEFFVPGEYRTVWADENRVCTWQPTGRNSAGGKPVREIQSHSSAEFASPGDV
ncbi:MAG: cupin domain-containing protein [Burkholderiales bacterium]|nr:cupin domain-containing protein [Burkholderiales bacterium]